MESIWLYAISVSFQKHTHIRGHSFFCPYANDSILTMWHDKTKDEIKVISVVPRISITVKKIFIINLRISWKVLLLDTFTLMIFLVFF